MICSDLRCFRSIWMSQPTNIESRVPASGTGCLTIFKHGVLMIVTADVIDVSRSGLQLEVDEPIELGGKIETQTSATRFGGEVKDCRIRKVGSYHSAFHINNVFEAAEFRHI